MKSIRPRAHGSPGSRIQQLQEAPGYDSLNHRAFKLSTIGLRITEETHPWVYLGGQLQRSFLEAGRAPSEGKQPRPIAWDPRVNDKRKTAAD